MAVSFNDSMRSSSLTITKDSSQQVGKVKSLHSVPAIAQCMWASPFSQKSSIALHAVCLTGAVLQCCRSLYHKQSRSARLAVHSIMLVVLMTCLEWL
eukprot:366410-Chlamydomonas_euryale.AAC.28